MDVLRGLVMVIMALDHTRDFFSNAHFDATDLAQTTPLLFFTRWITHFCAPTFVLLAGVGAYLSLAGGKSVPEISRFLLARGLWLMFLEIAVVSPIGWAYSWNFDFTRLQVIWVIGLSMVVMAALLLVIPRRGIAALGLVLILGHNVFDGARVAWLGAAAPIWALLHNLTPVQIFPHKVFLSIYPIIPWVGVMALGYGAGDIVRLAPEQRRRVLALIGLFMIALFVLIRATNLYGDPKPWAVQASAVFTVLSFVNCTKYPPSLLYVLMTLGPALMLLAFMDRWPRAIARPLATFGRVPLFYYILHLPLLHGLAVILALARHGQAPWLFHDEMQRSSAHPIPASYGYDLWVIYLVWIVTVAALYPLCRWYAGVKQRQRHQIFSYL